jgi:hypothetical protein
MQREIGDQRGEKASPTIVLTLNSILSSSMSHKANSFSQNERQQTKLARNAASLRKVSRREITESSQTRASLTQGGHNLIEAFFFPCAAFRKRLNLSCHLPDRNAATRRVPSFPPVYTCKIARFSPYYLHRIAECSQGACAILFRLPIGAICVPFCLRMSSLTLNDEGTGARRLEPLAFDR